MKEKNWKHSRKRKAERFRLKKFEKPPEQKVTVNLPMKEKGWKHSFKRNVESIPLKEIRKVFRVRHTANIPMKVKGRKISRKREAEKIPLKEIRKVSRAKNCCKFSDERKGLKTFLENKSGKFSEERKTANLTMKERLNIFTWHKLTITYTDYRNLSSKICAERQKRKYISLMPHNMLTPLIWIRNQIKTIFSWKLFDFHSSIILIFTCSL